MRYRRGTDVRAAIDLDRGIAGLIVTGRGAHRPGSSGVIVRESTTFTGTVTGVHIFWKSDRLSHWMMFRTHVCARGCPRGSPRVRAGGVCRVSVSAGYGGKRIGMSDLFGADEGRRGPKHVAHPRERGAMSKGRSSPLKEGRQFRVIAGQKAARKGVGGSPYDCGVDAEIADGVGPLDEPRSLLLVVHPFTVTNISRQSPRPCYECTRRHKGGFDGGGLDGETSNEGRLVWTLLVDAFRMGSTRMGSNSAHGWEHLSDPTEELSSISKLP